MSAYFDDTFCKYENLSFLFWRILFICIRLILLIIFSSPKVVDIINPDRLNPTSAPKNGITNSRIFSIIFLFSKEENKVIDVNNNVTIIDIMKYDFMNKFFFSRHDVLRWMPLVNAPRL